MDQHLQAILDSLPPKPMAAPLEPYRELICEMRRRRWTYREIALVLAEQCQVQAELGAIVEIVRPLRKRIVRMVAPLPGPRQEAIEVADSDRQSGPAGAGLPRRVERPGVKLPAVEPVFEYDENEPLRMISSLQKRA